MDQNKDLFELDVTSKCNHHNIDLEINKNDVITTNRNEKKKVARRRWAILAKALKSPVGSEPSSPTDEFSLRRISSFMLLTTQQLSSNPFLSTTDPRALDQITKRTWYKYSIKINDYDYHINIGHRNRTFSAEDLMGFNNTGNICIWPSEETLSYYVCANLHLFNNKTVLELGGGMSCLAGLFAAKFASAKHVTVTDGNKVSVENVEAALNCNDFTCPVQCNVLKWTTNNTSLLDEKFDLILCADCLFFDDARADLIDCLWNCLSVSGTGLIMAPQRGTTLDNFIAQSETKGFACKKCFNYNQIVWEKRFTLLDNCDYDDNIHYPILIELTKII